ncbi:MAG TPA: VWA domain-containing protein [candidate division Zixibacteria bacterium]|nr:VWA domain-containing protein [candidate division Zixibacteria bacterium]
MQDRLLEFAGILRRNGIRVSLAENVDALSALELVGVADPALFRAALRATLVKRAADMESFEELFDAFFYGLGHILRDTDRRLMEALGLSPRELQEVLERLQRLIQESGAELSELARALLTGDGAVLERLLREAVGEAAAESPEGFRLAPFTRTAALLQTDRLQDEIDRLKALLRRGGAGGDGDLLIRYLDQRLKDLYRMLREAVRQEQRKRGLDAVDRDRRVSFAEKSFAYYTEEDIRRMNEAVARLARRFKNRLSVRRKRAARGRFNLKRTLRRSLCFGGVPFAVALDRRRKTKPQVFVLCDVSDSVLNASRFMLQFVYSVQDLYSKVRSFIFVSDIGEVTKLFEENDIHRAVEAALRGDVIDVYSHSNFGRAFELFYRRYFPALDGRTTVLIIGDGRNNYNRPNDWVLREIRRKAKQLIWLNPESRTTWGVGDSEMPRYQSHCHVAEECRNLNQLSKLVDAIVP